MIEKVPIEIIEIPTLFSPADIEIEKNDIVSDLEKEVTNGCHLFVKVWIDTEKQIDMIIDTGASQTVFDKSLSNKYLKKIKLPTNIKSSGVNAEIDMHLGKLKLLRFGDFRVSDYVVGITDLSHINQIYEQINGKRIWGLLGSDFCRKYNAKIDYEKKLLHLKYAKNKERKPRKSS